MPVDVSTLAVPAQAPQGGDAISSSSPVVDRLSSEVRQSGPLTGIPILVVDDDPPSARLVRVLLAGAGAVVRTAYSAEEALELLREFPAQAFVVDLILPGMSGFVLARRLKAAAPDSVVIAISVVHGTETEQVALDSGCAALLHKPIDVNSFVQTIARLLGRTG
jgi:DNA-binding response OmpR family regulator